MKRILIVGGYGLVGSNIAALIRKKYPLVKLLLAGRNPGNGNVLAEKLGNAESCFINLEEDIDWSLYGSLDLIITSMEDHKNVLREAAVKKGTALIAISEVAEEIAPTVFLSLHSPAKSPIVFAGHWQAGILTLAVKHIAARFKKITKVHTAGVYDNLDPIGPMVASQVGGFVGNALIRENRNWQIADAKQNSRLIKLRSGEEAEGFPMSTLDVPSIAAFTDASDIRFDFAVGKSIGTAGGSAASHDLYIDMDGILLSGENALMRTVISGRKGNAHLTAVGVFLITEAILGSEVQSALNKGGLYLPEMIVPVENLFERLKEFDISIHQEVISNN